MYFPVIGLEVHVELNTKSKMFCSCKNDPEEKTPNFNICPVCTAQPGTLPAINEEAVKKVIKTGLALNCQIPEYSKFDRKNYFYPDLPKGYQISQYDKPIALDGELKLKTKNEKLKTIRIRRVHLEEDTGRLLHPEGADYDASGSISKEEKYSLVDLNRAGVPLMELVTEPDIKSGAEAKNFAEELQLILRYLNVSSADMEKGEMRVEVNISLSPKSKVQNLKLGTKVEIKNLNSFRSVEKAVEYEIIRQAGLLDEGKKIIQETRGWDDIRGATFSQRKKEEAHDYRYFPEPDLPPLRHAKEFIDGVRAEIPELPRQKEARMEREYKLDKKTAEIFVYNKSLGEYFEKVVSEFDPGLARQKLLVLIKLSSNYLISDLQGLLAGGSVLSENFLITPENFSEFVSLIYEGKISSKIAKLVLEKMFKTGKDPSQIIEEESLELISGQDELQKIIEDVVKNNPKAAVDYKAGKENALQYLVGQVMVKTRGRANPKIVGDILRETLTKTK